MYLEADRDANYTNLPSATRRAKEDLMRDLEGKHHGIREHAMAGAPGDFDRAPDKGAREHQQHMREREGMGAPEIRETRKEIREGPRKNTTRPGRPKARQAVRAGASGARSYRRYARQTGIPGAAGSAGATVLKAVGVGVGLTLLYLLINEKGKGPGALKLLLEGISSIVGIAVSTADPLNPKPAASSPSSSSSSSTVGGSPAEDVYSHTVPLTKAQAKKGSAFGPAPGLAIGGLIP